MTARYNLAHAREEVGDPAGATAALNDLLAECPRPLGPEHPDTRATRGNLTVWREKAGHPAT